MSISYEEALSTLQAMFGEPWTRESLDLVLRHFQGHMENTVESILANGDKDPQQLIDHLKNGGKDATALDEELARQLSSQGESRQRRSAPSGATNTSSSTGSSNNQRKLRGTPTTLPDDFLRVKTVSSQTNMDADEALARMLQDELFSEELRRNPDFAHLAGAGRRPNGQPQAVNRNAFTARGGPQQQQMPPLPNIMEKLSEMGTSAKFKLTQMAEQFKQNTNRFTNQASSRNMDPNGYNDREMRGLLDRDDSYDAYELASRKDL